MNENNIYEEYNSLSTRQVAMLTDKQIKRYTDVGVAIGRIKRDIKECRDCLDHLGILHPKEPQKENV